MFGATPQVTPRVVVFIHEIRNRSAKMKARGSFNLASNQAAMHGSERYSIEITIEITIRE
jgi:hypothetical protein